MASSTQSCQRWELLPLTALLLRRARPFSAPDFMTALTQAEGEADAAVAARERGAYPTPLCLVILGMRLMA